MYCAGFMKANLVIGGTQENGPPLTFTAVHRRHIWTDGKGACTRAPSIVTLAFRIRVTRRAVCREKALYGEFTSALIIWMLYIPIHNCAQHRYTKNGNLRGKKVTTQIYQGTYTV